MIAVIHNMREERRESLENGEDTAMRYHRPAMREYHRIILTGPLSFRAIPRIPVKIPVLHRIHYTVKPALSPGREVVAGPMNVMGFAETSVSLR